MTYYGYGTGPPGIGARKNLTQQKTLRNFKKLAASVESVYLVEASPSLRDIQKKLLCGDAPMEETEIGFTSRDKHTGLPVTWCEDIRFVPNGGDFL